MEGQRRRNCRRSQNGKPPRGTWQPTIPLWEKQFCMKVGLINWETVKERKQFTHLYENVANWDDSAGEEAFINAKKRFWAEINGLPCDLLMPDPDMYIDKIDWDSETIPDDFDLKDVPPNNHEPVIIFTDTHLPPPSYYGWGDEEDFKAPAAVPCEQNQSLSYDKCAVPSIRYTTNDGKTRMWNDYSRGSSRFQGNSQRHNKTSDPRAWNSINSCRRMSNYDGLAVGQRWNR